MSDDELGTQHEDVVTSLLDLQRQLRGDEDVPTDEAAPVEGSEPDAAPLPPSSTIVVEEGDLQILMTPMTEREQPMGKRFTPEDDRFEELQGRVERVEEGLTGVRGSIHHLKADAAAARAAEAAILDEVSTQRDELRHAIDDGFRRLQETLIRLRTGSPDAGDDGIDGTD
jgi:hypothetical protein